MESAGKEFSLSISGGPELRRKFLALGPLGLKVVAESLHQSAEEVARLSKEYYVPIRTGTLRNSIQASFPKTEGNNVTVSITAGGAARAYAVIVHETNRNYRNGRQWKYIETPLRESIPDILRELEMSLNSALCSLT